MLHAISKVVGRASKLSLSSQEERDNLELLNGILLQVVLLQTVQAAVEVVLEGVALRKGAVPQGVK